MSRSPSPSAPGGASGHSPQAAAEEPTCQLEARDCSSPLPFARDDLQQDVIDMLKPVDNDRLKEGMPDTEFNRKYPPDAWCEEAAPNARVWKICKDEATASDRDMLESWNKTLDVLLIFAGLFSAVSTAFLIESYKSLQPDYSQYVATFLYSAAVAYDRSGSVLPPLDAIRSPEGSFRSTTIERWINGLWFISLTISLLVALLSILVKQWLDEYRARVSRSAPDHAYWARRHALYYDGLRSWGVPVLISCLPLLLHVSLFLFLAGLVLFLQLLDAVIARAVLVILVLLLGLYLLSMALPAFYLDCPSKTQVLTHALHAWSGLTSSLAMLARRIPISWLRPVSMNRISLTRDKEEERLLNARDELDASAVAGILHSTTASDVLTVVAEALGGLSANSLCLLRHDSPEACHRVRRYIDEVFRLTTHTTTGFEVASYARCCRTEITSENLSPNPSYPMSFRVFNSAHFRMALGIEGALLCALKSPFTPTCEIHNLVAALRAMIWIPASPYPGALDHNLPRQRCLHLSVCLIFMKTAARIVETGQHISPLFCPPHIHSLAMLVFCAGLCASQPYSFSYEEQDLLQCLATIVHKGDDSHESTAARNGSIDSSYRIVRSRGMKALYTMLAHRHEYNIHPDVANLVVPYALSLGAVSFPGCADCHGLSDFILSDGFEQYTTSVEELAQYTKALSVVSLSDMASGPQRTQELLLCATVLASRAASLNFSPEQYYEVIRISLQGIFRHLYDNPRAQNEAVILSHFLSDPTVLARWMEIFWPWHSNEDLLLHPTLALQMRTVLAGILAYTLRRRSRVKLEVKPEWTHTLFSNQIAVRIAESALRIGTTTGPTNFDASSRAAFVSVTMFLRHWRHLSPSSWSSLCDHLHNSRGESGLAEEDVERFRDGLFPGDIDGAAPIDCDGHCPCRMPYELDTDQLAEDTHLSEDGSWRDRWAQRVKHWQPWRKRAPASNAGQEAHELSEEV